MTTNPPAPDPATRGAFRGTKAGRFLKSAACEVCDLPLVPNELGRPRRYCGPRCKAAAAEWAEVEQVIERARAAGDLVLAEDRQAWLDRSRADARDGWAGARARVAEVNARISKGGRR